MKKCKLKTASKPKRVRKPKDPFKDVSNSDLMWKLEDALGSEERDGVVSDIVSDHTSWGTKLTFPKPSKGVHTSYALRTEILKRLNAVSETNSSGI